VFHFCSVSKLLILLLAVLNGIYDSLTKLLCIEVGHISSQFTRCLSAAAVCITLHCHLNCMFLYFSAAVVADNAVCKCLSLRNLM